MKKIKIWHILKEPYLFESGLKVLQASSPFFIKYRIKMRLAEPMLCRRNDKIENLNQIDQLVGTYWGVHAGSGSE